MGSIRVRGVAGTTLILAAMASPLTGMAADPQAYGIAGNGALVYAMNGDLYIADSDGSGATAIVTGPETDSQPSFSRDGTHVAFLREEGGQYPKLMVARSDGSGLLELATGTDHFDWSPTGDRLLANHDVDARPSLSIVEADGSGIRTLEPEGITPTGHALRRPTGGDEVIFTGHPRAAASHLGLYGIRPDGTGLRTVGPVSTTESDTQQSFKGLQISPDGSLIGYWNWEESDAGVLDGYLHVRDLVTGADRRVRVRPLLEAEDQPQFSPDGSLMVIEAQNEAVNEAQLVVAPVDGSSTGMAIGPTFSWGASLGFAFSPDGTQVLLTLADGTSVIDLTSGETSALAGIPSYPTWQRLAPR